MISYAQNFEDDMLWRVLRYIEKSFYIDAGTWSPDEHSVTRLFYENNGYGINTEPNPEFYQQYLSKRQRDIKLNLAMSESASTTSIYFVDNPCLSSLIKSVEGLYKMLGFS